jgi:hypothetical protein
VVLRSRSSESIALRSLGLVVLGVRSDEVSLAKATRFSFIF